MKKKGLILFIIFAILISASYGVGVYFVNYALSPVSQSSERNVDDDIVPSDKDQQIILQNQEKEMKLGKDFATQTKETFIHANDGTRLMGRYVYKEENHLWAIMIHGYKSDNTNMMSYGAKYHEKGYNVVLPDNRAHGKSQGEYIGMGWLDKDDIACWIDWITQKDPQAQIILHGVSMGGATTMMIAGENKERVIGYVEDCGYTSVWDIFASELKKRFSLPTFPILDISNIVASLKAGYDFKEASSVEQVKKAEKPILFIHGGKDDFVPTKMGYEVYEAAQCEKELFIVDAAGHAESKDYNPESYWNKVFEFIQTKIIKS